MRVSKLRFVAVGIFSLVALSGSLVATVAQPADHPLRPPAMDSPRSTIQSLNEEVEQAFRARADVPSEQLDDLLLQHGTRLLAIDDLPRELQADIGVDALLMLYEVLSRIDPVPLDWIPGAAEVEKHELKRWVVPDTEIVLTTSDDPNVPGGFRFSRQTVINAPQYYNAVRDLPKQPGYLPIDVYQVFRVGVGPWLTRMLGEQDQLSTPDWARVEVLFVPAWKLAAAILIHVLAVTFAAVAFWISRRAGQSDSGPVRTAVGRMIFPLALMAIAVALDWTVDRELRMRGPMLEILEFVWTAIFTSGSVLFGFLAIRIAEQVFVSIAGLRERAADLATINLAFRIMSLLVAVGLLVLALQRLGVPVSGIITGLGVGGIAVALAAQSSLQNLLGGAVLLTDRAVRVGDFCRIGEHLGTLEAIGLRSSRLRGLDRTLVTIPNSEFASTRIENFGSRDQMLLRMRLGLRYETTPDQLRCILADIRALFIAHPKVAPDPARARLFEFGDSALDIELFAYVRSDTWDDYLAVREDLMLRLLDIIETNGSAIAFPSQTLYLRRDETAGSEATESAAQRVRRWRDTGSLPFPDFETNERGELSDTLSYPPEGSPFAATVFRDKS
jgi:MscS family membrane protein